MTGIAIALIASYSRNQKVQAALLRHAQRIKRSSDKSVSQGVRSQRLLKSDI